MLLGLLCYILMVKIYPFVSSKIEKIPYNLGHLIYYILLVVITIDMFISFSACIRMGLRHEGYKPLTGYGEFLDKVYNDERMKEKLYEYGGKMTTIISFLLIIYSLFLLVYSFFVMTRNNNSPKKSDTVTNKYCILIPARNESQVIEQLLISIEKQTKKINSKDVYIIVESKEDPTGEIVKKHNMNIIYRKDLTKKEKAMP